MRKHVIVAVGVAAVLASCGKGGGAAPTGQVLATVDGQEITAAELAMELGSAKAANPEQQKQLERAALQSIVNRKLLVNAAKEQGLDKTPTFAMQEQKARELMAVAALQQKISVGVPAPSAEEAQSFIAGHPDSFSQRKLFTLDQLFVPTMTPDLVRAMQPLKTMAQVEQLLNQRKIAFQRGVAALDGAAADPELVKRIAALPPGEVFVVPSGGGLVVNQIRETKVDPITGPRAVTVAQAMLKQNRTQKIVQNQLQQLVQAGAGEVKYNDAYAPIRPPVAAGSAEPKAAS